MVSPYIPNTDPDREAMLRAIGVGSIDELFQDIPASLHHPRLDLPPPLAEPELMEALRALSQGNAHAPDYACFLGGGAYHHFVPAVVRHIISRSEFLTSYTPYQAEISQGTLQGMYEFQSLLCQLTGMEVANDGMYDGATALAEAVLMACRITGRARASYLHTLSPRYLAVVRTYVSSQEIPLEPLDPTSVSVAPGTACVIVQHPNFFGHFEDVAAWARAAHDVGALLIQVFDPISLGLLRPPGDYGADIAVGEGQPLGTSLSYGGPYLGLFTCQEKYLRQMPGRIVGRTVDARGETGFVLTLQTREQHIRRERATSNICTSENLVALAAAVYLAALGKPGLRQVAELCYHKAHYLAQAIARLPGYSLPLPGSFFREFVVRCPEPPAEINRHLLRKQIIGGLDISDRLPNGMLLAVTEMNTRQQMDLLVECLAPLT